MSRTLHENVTHVVSSFLAMYSEGDFLNFHDDYNLGKYAFVLGLTKDWKINYGGNLYVMKPDRYGIMNTKEILVPIFNRLILFPIRPGAILHFVSPVTNPGRRIAFTGWVAVEGDQTEWMSTY